MSVLERRGRTSAAPVRVLIVGAGAVGQVYGSHLAAGGANVSLFVRPKYVAECAAGLRLYRMVSKRRRAPHTFVPHAVFSRAEEVAERTFDQVWLCVSTAALQRGIEGELGAVVRNVGQAALVVLQPGLHVPAMLQQYVPAEQIVDGGINMVSYQAPLVDGELWQAW